MIAPHAPVLLTTIIQKELTCLISVTRKSFIKKMFFGPYGHLIGPYGHFVGPYGHLVGPYGHIIGPYGQFHKISGIVLKILG